MNTYPIPPNGATPVEATPGLVRPFLNYSPKGRPFSAGAKAFRDDALVGNGHKSQHSTQWHDPDGLRETGEVGTAQQSRRSVKCLNDGFCMNRNNEARREA
jgi:hypothetical protein